MHDGLRVAHGLGRVLCRDTEPYRGYEEGDVHEAQGSRRGAEEKLSDFTFFVDVLRGL